jgi:hypothetical protein
MKAIELRIGNLVNAIDTTTNELCEMNYRVTTIAPNYVYVTAVTEITKGEDELIPIPLTEEWLLKFGFNEITHRDIRSFLIQSLRADLLYQPNTKRVFSFSEVDGNTWCLRTVKEVHTLQNLFYSLTGEELKTKQT